MSTPANLLELLERASNFPTAGLRFLDRREREQWVGWAEILHASQQVGMALAEGNIGVGERVGLVYPTGADFFRAFFGVLAAGAVPVPLYPPVRLGRRDEYHGRTVAMLKAAGASLVLAEERISRMLRPTIEAARPRQGCLTLEELLADLPDASDVEPVMALGPEALALVQFSSGTTVDPKPVALSHRAVVAQARILNSFWPDTDEVVHGGVSWLPLYHDMGLIGAVLPALERPGVLTLMAPETFATRPAAWLRTMSRYRATISAAPNFAYRLAVEKIRDQDLDNVDLSSWRIALTGAEAVAPSVLRRFEERFAPWGFRSDAFTPVYGLAEASLAVTFSSVGEPFRTRCFDREALSRGRVRANGVGVEMPSLGRPVPGCEIRIESSQEGRVGRVRVRGPCLMDGYLDQPEVTARTLCDGWLDTGDLGFMHNGELFLTGRAKDVVILRGRNYAPSEIERAVEGAPGVRPGCAVAVSHLPEGAEGEELLLFVESDRGVDEDTLAGIPRACREAVLRATGLSVDRVVVIEPSLLPRTSSGKLRRGETLRRHLAGELND